MKNSFKIGDKIFDTYLSIISYVIKITPNTKGTGNRPDLVECDDTTYFKTDSSRYIHFSDTTILMKMNISYYTTYSLLRPNKSLIEAEIISDIKNNYIGTYAQINNQIENGKDLAKIQYQTAKDAYDLETTCKLNEFVSDLEKEFGVENNGKKDLLYSISYRLGHSESLKSVYDLYSELSNLIK